MHITLFKFLMVGAFAGASFVSNVFSPTEPVSVSVHENIALSTHQAPDELDLWIEKLIQLESEGKESAVVLDVNGRYSYGCLQYQKRTFLEFGERFDLLDEEDKENIDALIFDCKLQRQLTRAVLESDSDGWKHWYTSVMKRGLGLPPVAKANTAEKELARAN